MNIIKGKQDAYEIGIRAYLDTFILGSKSIELVFVRWYIGIEWGKL